jgi:hypothetical protein
VVVSPRSYEAWFCPRSRRSRRQVILTTRLGVRTWEGRIEIDGPTTDLDWHLTPDTLILIFEPDR